MNYNNQIETMEQALESIDIHVKQGDEYRSVNDVLIDLRDKWPTLHPNRKQKFANQFVRYMLWGR